MMDIIDNFLDLDDYNKIKKECFSENINWFRYPVANQGDDDVYFSHRIFIDYEKSYLFPLISPLLKALNVKSLMRVKLNLYPYTHQLVKHNYHIDYQFKHKGAILSLNECDGGTYIEDRFIKSKDNRIILFDPSVKHSSTSTTNKEGRINININYF